MFRPHIIIAWLRIAPYLLFCQFTWLRKFSKHPEKTPIEVRYKKVRKLCFKIVKVLRLDVKSHGTDFINNVKDTYLGLCNHRNFIDPVFLIYFSEKPISFVAKKEAAKIPIVVRVIKSIDGLFIDREDIMSQVRLFKTVAERLKEGKLSYYIFPEGTRMKNKEQIKTLPYHDGSLKPAYWSFKNIIYCCHFGTHLIFEKMTKGFKKRNVTFEYHKPIEFNEIKDKPTTEVMPIIEKISNDTLQKIAKENSSRNLK